MIYARLLSPKGTLKIAAWASEIGTKRTLDRQPRNPLLVVRQLF
jgi:hypothetical protein